MIDTEARFEMLMNRLRERHYRMTPQRVALLNLLAASDGHPSAIDLFDQLRVQFPTTSLATVYKTLTLLDDMGEVLELEFSDGARYDGKKPYPHPHLICVRCRTVVDADPAVGQALVQEAARGSGFRIVGYRLDFYGLCPDCQATPSQSGAIWRCDPEVDCDSPIKEGSDATQAETDSYQGRRCRRQPEQHG